MNQIFRKRSPLWFWGGLVVALTVLAPLFYSYANSFAQIDPASVAAPFDGPTTSSPIVLSQDKNTVWVVNPDDGSVSVLGTLDNPTILTTVKNVGEEPQAIALDTGTGVSQRAYVVSPPDNGVTVLKVNSVNPFQVVVEKRITTGAEPWNVVSAPDGGRIFVANSGQDTITVIRADTQTIVGNINLRTSACNVDDTKRRFQPRGLAVTQDGTRLFVARFLSFTKPGGIQATDEGKEGVVCQIDLPADVATLPTVFRPTRIAAMDTGFTFGTIGATKAYPNQMQSIVVYGSNIYLPNIAASTSGPLRFNVDTQSFVNVVDIANAAAPADAPAKAINMHLGARVPESGKKKIFFSNPWAIGFRNNAGTVHAYAVSAGSDLLVKLAVDGTGKLGFTGGVSTTTYIDLNDPANAATSGRKAGKNPLGIVIRNNKAFVMNYISRNVSVVNLDSNAVEAVVETTALPPKGSFDEQLQVGAEIFFSARGNFNRPNGTTVSTSDRLSSEGWQNCASCHFAGWTDGNVWSFNAGPRKSVPLNSTWSPHNPDDQRVLNYSAIFDEVQDFELNIRNVSGPAALVAAQGKTPVDCAFAPAPAPANTITKTAVFDNQHGLLIGDDGDINKSPCTVVAFNKPNSGRPQLTITLPGSDKAWPALDAMKEWVRFAIRNPEGALTSAELPGSNVNDDDVKAGRRLFFKANCQSCHAGTKWTISNKDFISPPAAAELATEVGAAGTVQAQFLNRFLRDIGSFELGTAANPLGSNVGAPEKNEGGLNALGKDHNNDGKGNGFNVPSLLSLNILPPYYHNGACETLACVVGNVKHRTSGLKQGQADPLTSAAAQAQLVSWLETLDAETAFPTDLLVDADSIVFDPAAPFKGAKVTIAANIQLFGTRADFADLLSDLGLTDIKVRFEADPGLPAVEVALPVSAFSQDFGQAVITRTWDVPAAPPNNNATIKVTIDPANQLLESDETNNIGTRTIPLRNPPPDTTVPTISGVFISDDTPFDENDQEASSTNVKVKIRAADTGGNLDSYCIVRYRFNQSQRRWEPRKCTGFKKLPTAEADGSFIVNENLFDLTGITYAFVFVKDRAGNISGTPGFDVINLITVNEVEMNRNDVRIFRFILPSGSPLTLNFAVSSGDINVSVFDRFRNPDQSTLCALSAQAGLVDEQVSLPGADCKADADDGLFRLQVEVRAVANSSFSIETAQVATVVAAQVGAPNATNDTTTTISIAGPPLRGAIDAADDGATSSNIYLPLVNK